MKMKEQIESKKAKVAIIGMGYVGLPHAVRIAEIGFNVSGIDIDNKKINSLNEGISYIADINSADLEKVVKSGKFKAYNTFEILKQVDVVIICVPTPLNKYKIPDISYIKSSVKQVKEYIHKDMLVILESTTYPGTTEEVILPILESSGLKVGKDIFLSFAPERIDPGNEINFFNVTKVVGGVTEKCTDLTKLFYSKFIKDVHDVSSPRVAEMTKLLENIYRLINISTVNELALLCEKMKIDIWEVIEAAKTKPYGFQAFYPSPKAGGHCIPLDPFYLSWKAKKHNFWLRFIELSGEINELMPHYIVTKINTALNKNKKSINASKILIWGVSYKKDIGDTRESGAIEIIADLIKKGADLEYFDPFVAEITINKSIPNKIVNKYSLKSIKYSLKLLKNYDCIVILTDHSGFNYEEIALNSKIIVDTRNAIKSRNYKNVIYLGV